MFRLISILIGYFIGCIQSAFIVGKFMNVDIRNYGSGNLGSTNALRVLGKRAGAITFTCDILKAVIAFALCNYIFKDNIGIAGFYAAVGVVLGHDFPFYLKFKGGKGIASMIGMMLCIGGTTMMITFAAGIIGLLTKYVSVGSIMFSIAVAIVGFIMGYPIEIKIIMLVLGTLAVYRHKANIKRLIDGNENKLGSKKAQAVDREVTK